MRLVRFEVRDFEALGLPPIVRRIAEQARGLVLVTGRVGAGKTTTLAAMIDHIDETRDGHILTIEDPVEVRHADKRCIVSQRDVGLDTEDFRSALKRALRQDPDVVLIGEMRDPETVSSALSAADTGHLVLSTLQQVGVAATDLEACPVPRRDGLDPGSTFDLSLRHPIPVCGGGKARERLETRLPRTSPKEPGSRRVRGLWLGRRSVALTCGEAAPAIGLRLKLVRMEANLERSTFASTVTVSTSASSPASSALACSIATCTSRRISRCSCVVSLSVDAASAAMRAAISSASWRTRARSASASQVCCCRRLTSRAVHASSRSSDSRSDRSRVRSSSKRRLSRRRFDRSRSTRVLSSASSPSAWL